MVGIRKLQEKALVKTQKKALWTGVMSKRSKTSLGPGTIWTCLLIYAIINSEVYCNRKNQSVLKTEKEDIDSCISELERSMEDNDKIKNLRNQFHQHNCILDNWRKESFLTNFPEFRGHL